MKTPDYLNYERYKTSKKKKDSKTGVFLAITSFFITLLIFSALTKSFSPDIDVSIGEDTSTDAKETGLGVKQFIDERLKQIQMEDNSAGVSRKIKESKDSYEDSYDTSSDEPEEKVKIPPRSEESIGLEVDEPIRSTRSSSPPRPGSKDLSTPFESPKMTKVYVGRYSNIEQAKVAQGILLDSGLDITPFIKNMGGSFTLQVGSYTDKAKASILANELLKYNFPARIVQE